MCKHSSHLTSGSPPRSSENMPLVVADTKLPVQSSQLEYTSFILAALTAGGGIMGYAKTRSMPSIIAGCSVGLLYALGGYRIQNRQPYGVELSLLASVVLGGASIPRAIRLKKPVPILLSVLSTFGAVTFGSALKKSA
ncbi:transmembrane 14C domain protein [Cordyceps militaris CM01]|uniref:Transmembrane 14C domain protein n=2 Tax=Cordyceps militaris TaxID=73501 RepID=G3JN07_CORMM|nr:transmembrane 14C domain protein [Cordyceps militaris CM01]EGX90189.1 transmembrane 14C domain protein [Cordyceps militaris CM01]